MGIWEGADLRRIEDLIEDFAHWFAKEYCNAVQHVPLLQTPTAKLIDNDHSDTLRLTLTPPPPLHVIKLDLFCQSKSPLEGRVKTRAVESDFKKSNKSRMPKSF